VCFYIIAIFVYTHERVNERAKQNGGRMMSLRRIIYGMGNLRLIS